MARKSAGSHTVFADTKTTANRTFEVQTRLLYQFREMEKQVERLQYGSSAAKNSDLAFLRDMHHALDAALVNPEFFASNTTIVLNSLLHELENRAESVAKLYPPRLQLSREMTSTPGVIIPEIANNIRSNIALFIRYSTDLHAQQTNKPRVPPQQPAPIRVGLKKDSKLHLEISQTHKGSIPAASLERLRAATHELLQRTIDQLGFSTNVDPRLAPNLRGLMSYLSIPMSSTPIEALGLNFQFAKRSFQSTKDSVPDALIEQIDQVLTTTNVILTQYEEWRLYIAAEAVAEIAPADLEKIVEQSELLADLLDKNHEFVHPDVGARFREIIDAYVNGLVNIEAVAIPLIESFGNVFSIISQLLIGNLPDVAGNAISNPGSMVLLLGFSMKAVEVFAPTASAFPPLSYLLDVQKFAQKQFSLLKDSMIATGRG